MSEPVLGWAPIDEDALLDPARRPIGQVLREVAAVYRRDAGPFLILAALFEGTIGLFTLPYVVLSIRLALQVFDAMGRFFAHPIEAGGLTEMAATIDRLSQPDVAAYGGLVSIAPLVSTVLLTGAVAAFLAADREGSTAGAAARAVLRRWPAFVPPIAFLGFVVVALSVWSYALTGDMLAEPITAYDPGSFGASIAFSLLAPLVVAGAAYLAIRWAVAVPALILEGIGLRAALARSSALTARRRLHVGLCLLAVVGISAIVGWIGLVPFYVAAAAVLAVGGGPLLAAPLAFYLIGRIVLAPLVPILCAILYRDLRSAGPPTPGRPADDPAAPPGWGSTG